MDQLREYKIDKKSHEIGEYIIGCINDDGYLKRDVQEISEDLIFSKNLVCSVKEVLEVLNIVQSFDPPGIGGRDLKESLILQLKRKEKKEKKSLAIKILAEYFEYFEYFEYSEYSESFEDFTP